MIALLLLGLVTFAIPFLLLLALPIAIVIGMNRSGYAWYISLLPLLVPAAALASEAFPKWYVEALARAPLENTKRVPVDGIYLSYGSAEDAARMVVQHPDLGFAEGVLGSPTERVYPTSWRRIPSGLVRFHSSRPVKYQDDCGPNEIGVGTTGLEPDTQIHWYCTRWASVPRLTAAYELRHVIRQSRTGPYVVDEENDEVVRREDGHHIRTIVSASIAGGIVRQMMAAMDFLPGAAGRAKYYASTLGDAGTLCQEEFLLTGRIASECKLRRMYAEGASN